MEKIYTIPVNDAYSLECECPLCSLKEKAEYNYLEYYLGPSLMEPDTRIITNKTGFCPAHMGKLNQMVSNRLGLGLVTHTHLIDMNQDVSKKLKDAVPPKSSLLKGRVDYKSKLNQMADYIDKRVCSCPICEKLDNSMEHYIEVISYMFAKDPEFREKFINTKAHCLPHTAALLRSATKLSQNDASDFVGVIANNNAQYFSELIADVEWFTLKFDYRNKEKPWGNSKNSIQRSMRFLSSDRGDFDEQQKK